MDLVTGATGLLGSHVLYELVASGKPVRALFRDKTKIENTRQIFSFYTSDHSLFNNIEWVEADICNYYAVLKSLHGISGVYHVAGRVTFDDRDKKKLNRINIDGTANIVNACQEYKNIRLCHVSSIATLGELEDGLPVDETVIWNKGEDASSYSISKYKGEMEVWRGINEGLDAFIVNPSVIIGPGMWLGPGKELFLRIKKGLKYYPHGSSGYVDVRDVARIMVILMDSDVTGERFILNSGNISHKDFMGILAAGLGSASPAKLVTPALARAALFYEGIRTLFTGKPSRINRQTFKIASSELTYSNAKITGKLGYTFCRIEDSLKDAVKFFKNMY
ncbi:MAG TPA: NAD-dependent epimerase/dehydratase family protein [Bacteroidales bacterium]|nr:NAD-dependent epimerase/dehydratase family protein [Bacteroidales bacterium]